MISKLATLSIICLIGSITASHDHVHQHSKKHFLKQANQQQEEENGNAVDPTKGWKEIKLDYYVQKPWNIPLNERYQFKDGVHHFLVYKNDLPHTKTSHTHPRTEMAIEHGWTTGNNQFEGEVFVPKGTSGVNLLQIFGGDSSKGIATSFMMQIFDGTIKHYTNEVIQKNCDDRWIKVNLIHNADSGKIQLFLDGVNVFNSHDNGHDTHSFKCGAYSSINASDKMIVLWRNLKIFVK
ncbi:UNKNOWN [Stylonychia lemnae]|uniref:Alginate lyase 2 domain-containing protein n=1 Tax=Stylonychia lemnae TaxID=5949 RepID=A0A078AJW2_STYLE|nr:UNKNOWN [Stylonychia lemnae]|eukprot:CDW82675.1 UNKNOWN [Stylonychia lemnae]